MTDFEFAKDKVLMGAERRSMMMSLDERRNTAYHEGGPRAGRDAAAGRRSGAQGHDHPARHGARASRSSCRSMTATPTRANT